MSEDRSIPAVWNRRIESLLADYTAGALSEPFAVLVAAHLQMKAGPRGAAAQPRNATTMEDMNALMPLALRHYVSRHLGEELAWRTVLPGLKRCLISRDGDTEVSFLRCRAGKALPAHTHLGREAALVLQGGFHDVTGDYVRGDVAVADETLDHRPVVDSSGECIILLALEGPVKLTGRFGRLLQRIVS